jgi:hypothetical protein
MIKFSDKDDFSFYNHTKTQFGPVEIHVSVIKLLKYIQQKFNPNLEVWDEGDYWKTEDVRVLTEKIDFLNRAMDLLEDTLNSMEIPEDADAETIADKIEEVLKKMKFRKRR